MADSDSLPAPDEMGATEPMPGVPEGSGVTERVQSPTPAANSRLSPPGYVAELPLPEDLQAVLPPGSYVIESFLGQGGMGAVYRGLQMPLRRPVAIKILTRRQAGEEDEFAFEERFKREAYAMATLTHPHIVQVYDCGDAGENYLFISMELVEGGDLSDAIKTGACTPDAALKLIPQICAGMHAAHERGLVHRDIKPANIFLTKDGRAKVADFGLAKRFDVQSTFVTKVGLGMGTPDYAAPEQYEGVPDLDHRADIYALGVMMYQMLTGRLPRGANYKTPSQMMGVDPRIDNVVAKAMANDRDERYQSAAEIAADIAEIVGAAAKSKASLTRPVPAKTGPAPHVASPGARTPTPAARSVAASVPGRAAAPLKKKSGAAGVIAFVVALAVLAGGAWMMQQRKQMPSATDAPPVPSAPQWQPLIPPAPAPPVVASKDAPFINSLGMKFVPVPGTDVLFCIHETRWRDYAAYTGKGTASPDYPAGFVSFDDAQAFCAWLSRQEGRTYRPPTDREWSFAVGIGDQEKWNADTTPSSVNKVQEHFPWGNTWPPPKGAGNYRDETFRAKNPPKPGEKEDPWLQGYDDGFDGIAPVMRFTPNGLGIYDLGGNMWEWVTDWFDPMQRNRTLRGAGNASGPRHNRNDLLSSNRIALPPSGTNAGWGFRVALVNPRIAPSATASTPVAPATDGWEDLMAQLTPEIVAKTSNGWKLEAGALHCPHAKFAMVPLPGSFAGASYQLRVKLRKVAATEGNFHVVLPVDDRMTGLDLDGRGNIYTGLNSVDGQGKEVRGIPGESPQIKDSEPHDLEVTVLLEGTNARITTTLDARPVFEWTGPSRAVRQTPVWATTPPGSLAFGASFARWIVSEVKAKRLGASESVSATKHAPFVTPSA